MCSFWKCMLMAEVENFLFSGEKRYQLHTIQHGLCVLGSPFGVTPKHEQVIDYSCSAPDHCWGACKSKHDPYQSLRHGRCCNCSTINIHKPGAKQNCPQTPAQFTFSTIPQLQGHWRYTFRTSSSVLYKFMRMQFGLSHSGLSVCHLMQMH